MNTVKIRCMIEAKMITTTAAAAAGNSLFRPNQLPLSPPGGSKFVGIHFNFNSNLNGAVMRIRRMRINSSSSSSFVDDGNSSSVSFLSDVASTITTEDDHGGVILEIMPSITIEPSLFTSLLQNSILHWKQQGKKGVWIKLPIQLVHLIQPAVNQGFYFHHAEPTYLMLVHWIPQTPNTLPSNASHRVGVGAFVMKQDGQVLVVQEKGGKMRGTGVWKFPTGVVDEGEDICDAAVREVKEETGIDAKFVEILAFRQGRI